jgi:hypothetical protein
MGLQILNYDPSEIKLESAKTKVAESHEIYGEWKGDLTWKRRNGGRSGMPVGRRERRKRRPPRTWVTRQAGGGHLGGSGELGIRFYRQEAREEGIGSDLELDPTAAGSESASPSLVAAAPHRAWRRLGKDGGRRAEAGRTDGRMTYHTGMAEKVKGRDGA